LMLGLAGRLDADLQDTDYKRYCNAVTSKSSARATLVSRYDAFTSYVLSCE
jgi:hypothetical protein